MFLRADQFRAALVQLNLRRSDIASLFDYSWPTINLIYKGERPVPAPMAIAIILWCHPDFPESLRPKSGVPYRIDTEGKYFTRRLT